MRNKITALLLTLIMAISYVSPVAYAATVAEPVICTVQHTDEESHDDAFHSDDADHADLTEEAETSDIPSEIPEDETVSGETTVVPSETIVVPSESVQESALMNVLDDDIVNGGLCGELVEWVFYASGKLVISGIGEMHEYATSNDVPWHAYSSGITSVVFEDAVTSICNYAFKGCSNLEEITFTETITDIGDQAFADCISLQSVVIPASVKTIGSSAFANCPVLSSVSLPENLVSIGRGAFASCTSLGYIAVHNVSELPDDCFNGCTKLETVALPEHLEVIGSNCFANCPSLKSITMPDTVTTMGSGAFYNCTSLANVYFSNSLETISDYAFYNCSLISEAVIPNSVNAVGKYAFFDCISLRNVILPSGVTYLGDHCFDGCSAVTEIQLPADTEKIGDYAFANCFALESMDIPENTASIGQGAFSCCVLIEEIVIPESITELKANTFENCTALKKVTLPESLESIGAYSFSGCESITELLLGGKVATIGESAFVYCSNLKELYLPSSLASVGKNVLTGSDNFKYIYYHGSESEWNNVSVAQPNDKFNSSQLFYNCCSVPHVWKDATCTEKVTCTVCGVEIGEALGHTEVVDAGTPPTCTETGISDGKHCTVCNTVTVPQTVLPANGHSWDKGTVTTEPTCTTAGETTYECTVCEETKTEPVAAKGHSYTSSVTKEPTCTETGIRTFTCSTCGDSYTETIAENGHNSVLVEGYAATCTQTGLTDGYKCSVCNEILSAQVITPANGHSWDKGTVTTEPTCTTAGERTYECTVCEETKTEVITENGHTEEIIPGKEATCTETGLTDGKKCTVCGVITVAQQEIKALGHTDGEVVVENNVDPTCTVDGSYDNVTYCTVCNAETSRETITVDALGHTEAVDAAKAPTCTETGLTEGKHCSVCGTVLVKQNVVDALGHTDGEVVVENNVAPTCTVDGNYDNVTYCTVCNAETSRETVTVDALGHTEEVVPGKEATCTETGLTEGKKCTVCGVTTVAQEEIKALGHTEVVDAAKAPTCTETGLTEGKHCSVCGTVTVKQNIVDALGHTSETIKGYAATCTTAGLTDGFKCSVCNEILFAQEVIPASGHNYESEVTKPATCTETGIETFTCKAGDHTYTKTLSALGHDLINIPIKEPTCTETGVTAYKDCSRCDYTEGYEIIPEKGHSYEKAITDAPTCTETGSATYTCSVCGDSYTAVEPALGHDLVYDTVESATCTTPGEAAGSHCTRCDFETGHTEIPALGHDWGEGVVTEEPTCIKTGVRSFECSRCDETKTEDIPANGHTEVSVPGKKATCTETGLTDGKKCTVCGVTTVAQEEIKALGHTDGEVVVENNVAPTCTVDGSYDNVTYCTVCNAETNRETVTVTANGHTEVVVPGKGATCTETGLTDGKKCTVCGVTTVAQEEIKALGHTDGEVVVENNVAPTCTVDGSYDNVTYCTVCNAETSRETITVDALGHTEEVVPGKKATCTETGLTDGKKCTVCGVTTVAQEEIKALGHTDGEVVVENNVAPTCTVDGSYDNVTYCTVCNAETSRETITVDALGHTEVVVPGKEATCTETGLTDGKKCTVCGVTTVAQEEIKALGHTDGEVVVENNKAPTCTVDGSYDNVTYCTVCNAETSRETVTVTASGHNYESEVTKPATCTETGVETFTCSVCGDNYTEELEATGHSFTQYVLNGDGTKTAKCDNCDETSTVNDEVYGGTFGDNIIWFIDSTNALYIKGAGEMGDAEHTEIPWAEHADIIRKAVIDEEITTIAANAFSGCTNLETVNIPESATSIGENAFNGCESLSEINIPETVTEIQSGTFSGCASLTTILIPETVTAIGENAFSGCTNLSQINIPEAVTEIPSGTFSDCQSFTTFHIPVTVTAIGENAFNGCVNLETVYYGGTQDKWDAIQTDDTYGCLSGKEIIVLSDYETSENDDGTLTITGVNLDIAGEYTVPSEIEEKTVTAIGDNAFADCADVTDLTVPETITSVGAGAFSGCTGLETVTLPDSITEFGEEAFDEDTDALFIVNKYSHAHKWLVENGYANIYVLIALEEIRLPENITLTYGTSEELTAEILPADTTDELDLSWTVADESIVTYNAETGVLSAKDIGITEITVTDNISGMSATSVVTVKLPSEERLKITVDDKIEAIGLEEGEQRTLTVSSPSAGIIAPHKLDFTSSAPEHVSVDENGRITALYTGEDSVKVKITATIKSDSTKKVTFRVRVVAKQINLIRVNASIDESVSEECREQIKIIYPYTDNTPVVVVPKALVEKGTLPINLAAVAVDGEYNESAINVIWKTDAAAVATVAAVRAAKGQPASEVWGLAKATVRKNIKANGIAVITATTRDAKKLKATVDIDVRDYTPRLEKNVITLNSNLTDGTQVKLYTAYSALLKDYPRQAALFAADTQVINVALEDRYGNISENFYAEYDINTGMVTINSYDVVKNGTHKLTLKAYTRKGETSQAITLRVVNKLPVITFKQPTVFNRFYKDSTADVFVTAKNETVTDIELIETETFAATEYNAETGSFTLVYADTDYPLDGYNANGTPDAAAKVKVYVDGYKDPVVKALSIRHNEVKPKLSQNRNSTAYTYLNNINTPVQIIETVGKEKTPLSFDGETGYTVSLAETSDGYAELAANGADIVLSTILGENNKFANGKTSHAAKLKVNHDNWLKPIEFTHTITVNTTKPTIKAKTPTLTISSLYNSEVSTDLSASIANCPVPVEYRISAVKPDENTSLIDVTANGWTLTAAFADVNNLPASGNYIFSVVPVVKNAADESVELAAFNVTVTVNNKVPTIKPEKSTVTLKGENYEGIVETAILAVPADCPAIRYEVVPANAAQKDNTDKLAVSVSDRTISVGFADVNNLPANGSYRYTINGYITDIAGNKVSLAPMSITVNVSTTAPKVTLEKTAVTLNKDFAEKAEFKVKALTPGYEIVGMNFTTTNANADGKVTVNYDSQNGIITAAVADNTVPNGVYTYNGVVDVKVADETVTTTQPVNVTLRVTVKSGKVTFKTTAKGNIDLAIRSKGITYTVTGFNNFNYEASMIDANTFKLTGPDSDKFDLVYTGLNAKGQHTVMVTAKTDAQLNRGKAYKYNISANVAGVTEAVTLLKDVSVTTRQSVLRLKATGTTTIYHSYKRTSSFTIDVTRPDGAKIANVELMNTRPTTLPANALKFKITDNGDGTWKVSYRVDKASAIKVNRVYRVAFEITPEGNGENVKPQRFIVNFRVKR